MGDFRRTRRRVLVATMAGCFGMLAGCSDPEDGADDTGVRY